MFLYRNWGILLHNRCRRVRCKRYGIMIFSLTGHNNRSVRRIWFWRHSPLIFTGFTCFFCGGILSEFVQAALPVESFFTSPIPLYFKNEVQFKNFEWGDVMVRLTSPNYFFVVLTSALGKSFRI